ncbi:MAG: helix-turn-helix domain-containing protein [Methanosarcinales archaeon]
MLSAADYVLRAALESDERFVDVLKKVIKEDLHLTQSKFSELSGIPHGTLYKILTGKRNPNLKTFREILKTIRRIDEKEERGFIAVIAARPVLDNIIEKKIKVDGILTTIREYSATSVEDAIIAAVKAERDGATALVCAPIVSTTVEKILHIPVTSIMPTNSLINAIKLAARKMK